MTDQLLEDAERKFLLWQNCSFSVISQVDPDPDFPTVKFPNPEEGRSALVSYAESNI